MNLFHNSNVIPLEIWHGLTIEGPLYKHPSNPPGALEEFLLKLHRGTAETLYQNDTRNLASAIHFDRLILTGGRSKILYDFLSQRTLPFQVQLLPEGKHTFERRLKMTNTKAIIDWGQNHMKLYFNGALKTIPRDLKIFPMVEEVKVSPSEAIARIRAYITGVILDENIPAPIALALPVKILDLDLIEPSTYQGLEGSLNDLFRSLPILEDAVVLNDAVLALLGLEPALSKDLIVTCGYGYGAALWQK